jgi:hypothetical protein
VEGKTAKNTQVGGVNEWGGRWRETRYFPQQEKKRYQTGEKEKTMSERSGVYDMKRKAGNKV